MTSHESDETGSTAPLRHRVARGVLWILLSTWSRQVLSVVILLFLSRLLEPDAFGLIAICRVYTMLVSMVIVQGLADALVQRDVLDPEHTDSALWFGLIISIAFVGITFLGGGVLADLFGDPRITAPLRVLSFTFILATLQGIPEAVLRRKLAFRVLAVRSMVGTCVGGGVGIAMAASGLGVWSLVGHYVSSSFAGAVLLWFASKWRPSLRLSWRHLGELLNFSATLTGSRVVGFVSARSPDVVIGYALGAEALGYYTIGFRLLRQLLTALTTIARQVALPAFSRAQHQTQRLKRAFLDAVRLTSLAAFPAFAAAVVLAPDLLPAWFGPRWVPSVLILQILAVRGWAGSLQTVNTAVLTAVGRADQLLRLRIGYAVLVIPALVLSAPFGLLWVVAAQIPPTLVMLGAVIWTTNRLTRVAPMEYLRQLLVPTLATSVMVGVLLGVREPVVRLLEVQLGLICLIVIGLGLYAVLVLVMDRSLGRQLVALLGALSRRGTGPKGPTHTNSS